MGLFLIEKLAAIVLMGGTGWTFGSRLANLKAGLGTKEVGRRARVPNYNKAGEDLEKSWRKSQAVLVSLSGLGVCLGLTQLIVSGLVAGNCLERLETQVKVWLMTQILVFLTLSSGLCITVVTALSLKNTAEKLDTQLQDSIGQNSNDMWDSLHGSPTALYAVVCLNMATVLLLFTAVVGLLRRQPDYEPIESRSAGQIIEKTS